MDIPLTILQKELKVTADYIYNRISRGKKKFKNYGKGVCNMDKRLLSMLNELQYSDEEIARLEKADETINIDKYYVKNGELLKKLTVQMLEESVRKDLQEGEEIECEILVEEGVL